jgi:hypothetical protein
VADDLNGVKRATAILATCIVQTLNEADPSFQRRFVERLDRAYGEIRNDPDKYPGPPYHELELLTWVRTLLTGFNPSTGQGRPFLE